MDFRWNEWNGEHIAKHGVLPEEAQYVVAHAQRPWPKKARNQTWEVFGHNERGRLFHVVYVFRTEIDEVYVIHARPLSESEKRRYRRGRR